MILSEFGSAAFAAYFPGGKDVYIEEYFYPALQTVWQEICPDQRPKIIGRMGGSYSYLRELQSQRDSETTKEMVNVAQRDEQIRLEMLQECCPGAGVFVCGQFPDIMSKQICQAMVDYDPSWWIPVDPGSYNSSTKIALADSMFVNSWDPHSIVGNGNANDTSMDGHIGRCTEMAALSFFGTNSEIKCQRL